MSKQTKTEKLTIESFEKMYLHTKDSCKECKFAYSCCDATYCEMAKEIAKRWGVTLQETGHPKLPFLGEQGCIVPPHLRPLCTLHDCDINSKGFKPLKFEWTEKYFKLRDACEEVLTELAIERGEI